MSLSLSTSANSNSKRLIKRTQTDEDTYLKICFDAVHKSTDGEITYDIRKGKLSWKIKKGAIKSVYYKNDYSNIENFQDIILISKNEIKDVDVKIVKNDDKQEERIAFCIFKKDGQKCVFSTTSKTFEFMENKFKKLLISESNYKYYESKFKNKLNYEEQKIICLFLENKYLLKLFKKLNSCYHPSNIDSVLNIIKILYPKSININLGKNRIQLSRDEELIMCSERKYDINKLINSDSDINKCFKQMISIDDDKCEEFIDIQRSNKTYISGEYRPIKIPYTNEKSDNNDNKNVFTEEKRNKLFEELEKDNNYYDIFESNYLYQNTIHEDQKILNEVIQDLNNYSINKMKDINFFSYSSMCDNAYRTKKNMKKNLKQNSTNNKEDKMEIEEIESCPKPSKEGLLKKINIMEEEFKKNEDKYNNNNSYYQTMKKINEEKNEKIYLLKESTETLEVYLRNIYDNVCLMKDLSYALKIENHISKKNPNELFIQKKVKKEIKDIYDNIINEINNNNLKGPYVKFLLDKAKSIRDNITKY